MDLNSQSSKFSQNITNIIKKLNYNDLILFLIPFIIFLYYLYVFDPGILSYDSYNQLHQIATGEFNSWHPFFHTFIEMLCIKLYPSPLSIGFVQITTFSLMWMVICKYNRKDDENTDFTLNNSFILQVIFTVIISLIPINGIYSISLWKDILFSYLLMFLCFLIQVILDKKGNVSFTFVIILSLVMAFVSQIRLNGIYVILILFIVLGVYFYKNNKSERLYIAIPALTIALILLISSLNVAYDVEDIQKDAVFVKTSHMLADYDLNIGLDDGDEAKLHEMMTENDIQKYYNPTYSDPIYDYAANEEVYDNNKGTYIGMAIKYSIQNPLNFIGYMFGSAPMVWDIIKEDNWKGYVYSTDIDSARDSFYKNYKYTSVHHPVTTYDGVHAKNAKTDQYYGLESYVNYVKDNKLLDTLFDSPALYMYLAFIVITAIYALTKSKNIFLIYLPNMLNIIIIFVSTPIQDNRYLYPNILVFYLLIIILIGIIFKNTQTKSPLEQQTIPKTNVNYIPENKEYTQEIELDEEMRNKIIAELIKEFELKQSKEPPFDSNERLRKK